MAHSCCSLHVFLCVRCSVSVKVVISAAAVEAVAAVFLYVAGLEMNERTNERTGVDDMTTCLLSFSYRRKKSEEIEVPMLRQRPSNKLCNQLFIIITVQSSSLITIITTNLEHR